MRRHPSAPALRQVPVEPAHALLVPAAVYLLWQMVAASTLLVGAWPRVDEALTVWSLVGLGFGLPFGILLGALGRRLERRGYGREPSWAWYPVGLGLAFAAHWASVAYWPGVLWAMSAFASRSSRWVEVSLLATGAWVAVGFGVLVAWQGLRAVARRASRRSRSSRGAAPWLPESVVVGLAYVAACATPAVLGVGWLSADGWQQGGALPAIVGWLLSGAGMAALAGGLATLWYAADQVSLGKVPELRRAPRLEFAGSLLVAHWLVVFGLALTPAVEAEDLRWSLLALGFVLVLAGTSLWSIGRHSRGRDALQ